MRLTRDPRHASYSGVVSPGLALVMLSIERFRSGNDSKFKAGIIRSIFFFGGGIVVKINRRACAGLMSIYILAKKAESWILYDASEYYQTGI